MTDLTKVAAPNEWSNNWTVVLGSFWANLCVFGIQRSNSVIFVGLLDDFGWSREDASWPFVMSIVCICIGSVATSYLSRYFSMRQLAIAASLLSSVPVSLCYFAIKLGHFIVLYGIMQGIGLGIFMMMHFLTINNTYSRYRTRALGLSMSGCSVGMFICTPLMQMTLREYRTPGLCLLIGAIMLNSILGMIIMTSQRPIKNDKKDDQLNKNIAQDGPKTEQCNDKTVESTRASPSKPIAQRLSTLQILSNPDFLLSCLIFMVFRNIFAAFSTVILDFTRDRSFSDELGSYLVSGTAVADTVGRLCYGWIADTVPWTQKTLAGFSLLLLALTCLLLPLFKSYVAFSMGSIFLSLLCGCSCVCHSPLLVDSFGLENLPIVMGYFLNIIAFATFVRIPIVGYFRDQQKSYDLMFISLAVAQIAALVLFFLKDFLLKMKKIFWTNNTTT